MYRTYNTHAFSQHTSALQYLLPQDFIHHSIPLFLNIITLPTLCLSLYIPPQECFFNSSFISSTSQSSSPCFLICNLGLLLYSRLPLHVTLHLSPSSSPAREEKESNQRSHSHIASLSQIWMDE